MSGFGNQSQRAMETKTLLLIRFVYLLIHSKTQYRSSSLKGFWAICEGDLLTNVRVCCWGARTYWNSVREWKCWWMPFFLMECHFWYSPSTLLAPFASPWYSPVVLHCPNHQAQKTLPLPPKAFTLPQPVGNLGLDQSCPSTHQQQSQPSHNRREDTAYRGDDPGTLGERRYGVPVSHKTLST